MTFYFRSTVRILVVGLIILLFSGMFDSQSAHATLWDGGPGGTGTDLGTAANWAGDTLPSVNGGLGEWDGSVAGALSLDYASGLSGSAGNTGLDLSILATQTGSLSIDASTTTSLRLDDITIAAGAGAFTLGNGSAPTFNITLGGNGGETHTWTNDSSNTATISSEVAFGLGGGGNHQFEFSGSGNWAINNAIGGNTSVRSIGTGAVTLNGSIATGGVASILVSGTSGVATLNVASGATINISGSGNSAILIGNSAANTMGAVNQTGGSVSITNLIMGASGASNYAFYNKSAGTYSQTGFNRTRIGQGGGAGSAILMYHSGGTFTTSVGIALNDTAGSTAGTGGAASLYVNGGTMTSTVGTVGSTTDIGLGIGGRQGQSEVTIADSGSLVLNGLASLGGSVAGTPAAGDAGRTAVLNLGSGTTGGTLQTSMVAQNATVGALPLGYLNFNGGTLKAQTANANFLIGLTQATVHSGGGTIDNNGVAITIGQDLVSPTGDGVTSIAVSGATGYRGAPYVQLTGGGFTTPATAVANLDSNGEVVSITVTNPGTGYTGAPTVTLVGGGGAAGTTTPSVGAITGGGLTFQGSGTTTLAGAGNNYSGTTTVSAGTLLVNGAKTGSGAVNVSSGATLGGTDSVAGNVSITGGTLAPGASVGNLTMTGNVTIDSNGFFQVEYDSTLQTIDLATVGGSFDINGGTVNFADVGSGALDQSSYVFATFTGGTRTFSATNVPAGYLVQEIGQSLVLVQAIPEAGAFLSVGLVGLLCGGFATVRRQRRTVN
jgi:autotransporter-associated beta strand protein